MCDFFYDVLFGIGVAFLIFIGVILCFMTYISINKKK